MYASFLAGTVRQNLAAVTSQQNLANPSDSKQNKNQADAIWDNTDWALLFCQNLSLSVAKMLKDSLNIKIVCLKFKLVIS